MSSRIGCNPRFEFFSNEQVFGRMNQASGIMQTCKSEIRDSYATIASIDQQIAVETNSQDSLWQLVNFVTLNRFGNSALCVTLKAERAAKVKEIDAQNCEIIALEELIEKCLSELKERGLKI
jgi:hypothetical protein